MQASAAPLSSGALQPIVDQHYPETRLKPADAGERQSAYAVLRTTPANEAALIVAAYTDRTSGAIRVLRADGAGGLQAVWDQPDSWLLPGGRCTLRLQDVDFDGEPEIFAYFQGVRASVGWIFRWDGAALASLTPTSPSGGRDASILLGPVLYDLEHSGALRVVAARSIENPGPDQRPRNPAFVYRLGPNGFAAEKSILAVMGFRADVDPSGNVRPFRLVQDSAAPFRMRVINGNRAGGNRVDGATIFVNDVAVLGPAEVNARIEFTTTVLPPLTTANRVRATLTGAPEASIVVLIEDSTSR
jgi:hypothetical protein